MTTLYWDIETAGGEPWNSALLCVGYAVDDKPARVVTPKAGFCHDDGSPSELREMLIDETVTKVSFTKYDPRWFMLDDTLPSVNGPIHDAQVMAWVLNENTQLDLEWVAKKYAGVIMDKRLKKLNGMLHFQADNGDLYALSTYEGWPPQAQEQMFRYCKRDVEALRDVYKALYFRMEEAEWLDYYEREEVPYTRVLTTMETRGLPINLADVEPAAEEVEALAESSRDELLQAAGLPESFNLNSQPQLVAYLFSRAFELKDRLTYDKDTLDALKACAADDHEDCDTDNEMYSVVHVSDYLPAGFVVTKLGNTQVEGYWPVKGRGLAPTPKTKNVITGEEGKLPSVSSPELLYMHADDEWVRTLCTTYRKYQKVLTTYLRVYPKVAHNGRIYSRYNQTGTVTGRLSSSGPNMQNQPARGALGEKMRALFQMPEPWWFVIGDYDQLEMRLFAHFSGDPRLTQVFRDGEDPHVLTAMGVFGVKAEDVDDEMRTLAKNLNYAMGYGAGPRKVAQMLSLQGFPTTKDTAKGYLDTLQDYYHGFFNWKYRIQATAKRKGNVATLGGRRRRLRATFRDTADWKLVSYGERQAVNSIIQGTAADIIRRSMVVAEAKLPELPMLAQIHDEVLFESHREQGPHLDTLMEVQTIFEVGHGFDLRVPLVFEPHVVHKWSDKKLDDVPELEDEDADAD